MSNGRLRARQLPRTVSLNRLWFQRRGCLLGQILGPLRCPLGHRCSRPTGYAADATCGLWDAPEAYADPAGPLRMLPASGRGALDAARDRTPVGGGYALLESRTMTWLQRHAGNESVSRLLAVQRWGDVDAGLRTCHREDTEAPP